MEQVDISHREIYDRLIAVEAKVDCINRNTEGVVRAFEAAQGAFTVLEWLARLAKPILWLMASSAAIAIWWQTVKEKL